MLNRLWPLLISTVGAGALAFLVPQVPAIAAGFAIIWALAWRRQARRWRRSRSATAPASTSTGPRRCSRSGWSARRASALTCSSSTGRRATPAAPDRARELARPTSPARPTTGSTSGRCSSTPTGWPTCSRWRRRSSSPGGAGGAPAAIPTSATRRRRWGFPAGLIGGRIYFLITTPSQIPPHWWGPFAIWKGGLGIWGGIAAGCCGGLWHHPQAPDPRRRAALHGRRRPRAAGGPVDRPDRQLLQPGAVRQALDRCPGR